MTNGMPVVVRAAMKPLSTLLKPIESVNYQTRQPAVASVERSDVCAVPACEVIVEAVVAYTIADALIRKLGHDSLEEMKERFEHMTGEKLEIDLPQDPGNLYLVGSTGTGKSRVGSDLSRLLNRELTDTNEQVEGRAGKKAAEILADEGEETFRALETEVIKETTVQSRAVIAVGDGAVLSDENIRIMKDSGTMICLNASGAEILARATASGRSPLLEIDEPEKKITELLEERGDRYAQADLQVDTEGKPVERIINEILDALKAAGGTSP